MKSETQNEAPQTEAKPPRSYEWGELQCGNEPSLADPEGCTQTHLAYYDKETEEIFAQVDGRPMGSWLFHYQGKARGAYMTQFAARKAAEAYHANIEANGPEPSPFARGMQEAFPDMLAAMASVKGGRLFGPFEINAATAERALQIPDFFTPKGLAGVDPADIVPALSMPACSGCGQPAVEHVRDRDGNYPCSESACQNYEYTKGETLPK